MTVTAPEADTPYMLAGKRIWVAGHTGMVGSAVVRRLAHEPCTVLTVGHDEVDLTRQAETEAWMRRARPDAIVVAAARVGGILANAESPADFLYDNVMIAANVMRAAHETGVEKLLWLSSSCVYPRDAPQPISEDMLLSGPLEKTNEAYAIAKIAGAKLAAAYNTQHGRRFITAMPTNIYGPNDNFDVATSHVLPALMRKLHEARMAGKRSVTLWGTGKPLREFLHVDDLADACVHLLRSYDGVAPVNVGSGQEISIHELALLIARVVGFEGVFVYDTSKPDGTPRKRLDTSVLDRLGWKPRIALEDGIREMYVHWLSRTEASAAG